MAVAVSSFFLRLSLISLFLFYIFRVMLVDPLILTVSFIGSYTLLLIVQALELGYNSYGFDSWKERS